ncbi:MAG: DUF3794 domain-containing protein [Firmicutes bacterium]|nr:DUF3794 domain-containing protein [Bacillota bacterium]
MLNVQIVGLADPESFPIAPTMFTEIAVMDTVDVPEPKPPIEQLVSVLLDVTLKSTRIIQTPVGTSVSGLRLTGCKLVVEGNIDEKITYVASEPDQPVHAVEGSVPFSTFVVIPPSVNCVPVNDLLKAFKVTPFVEDVFVDVVSPRKIFKNIILFLDVSITNLLSQPHKPRQS